MLLLWGESATTSFGQVWQWSVPVQEVVSPETNDHPRAFLWIPPQCKQVRAVVVGQHNMLEEGVLEHPEFRAELARLGIAEVWVTPGINVVFDFQHGAGEQFEGMMQALAAASGYQELAEAPVVPIGHSALASYPWNFAAWNPGRTLAIISLKGDAPLTNLTGSGRPNPDWGSRTIDGVPALMVIGEYEWMEARMAPALTYRTQHPAAPISLLVDAGHGHFDFSDPLIEYLNLFLRKAVAQRLPIRTTIGKPGLLTPIDPTQGWLGDRWRPDAPPQAPAAAFAAYTGKVPEAFWYFDQEMAAATEQHYARMRGKQPQLLGFVQDGKSLPQTETHQQINLRFTPLADGMSFRVSSVFLDSVPAGSPNPPRWTHLPVGAPLTHAPGPVAVSRITGPVVQTGPDTWAIQFYRMGLDNPRRSNDIWLLASHPGDARFKSAVQQANLRFPLQNKEGAAQHITFPPLANVKAKRLKHSTVPLAATSDANVPVHYYVQEGPVELKGNSLIFSEVPPRAKFPVKVTVVAWQYGRGHEPKLQTATPVLQTFYITK
ncbi:hypothetical protein FHG12_16820 [Hymenobacter jejuensis]|uniref:Alpha/beta hydrolase n=2 Tax=Hymenobacter jejuensis TaxID=2502781 RepID=A0A5B8A7P8_9BACT|nr:hypothetical protein FHG12_16820 [Hymenobacter jejuensis]